MRMPNEKEYFGYKNPPKEHQFKKGQSGNPKGRPKGSYTNTNFRNYWLKEAHREVTNMGPNGPEKISMYEALVRSLFLQGAKGNVRAAKIASEYTDKAYQEELDYEIQILTITRECIAKLKLNDEQLKKLGVSRNVLESLLLSFFQNPSFWDMLGYEPDFSSVDFSGEDEDKS